jgi:hypothetical protein
VSDRELRAGGAHTDFFLKCPGGREPSEFGGAVVAEIVRRRNAEVSILDLGGGTPGKRGVNRDARTGPAAVSMPTEALRL